MPIYCEICGKEIRSPNYIEGHFQGLYDDFNECALCTLDFSIDQYQEFKDDFSNDIEFHITQLTEINRLNGQLLSFK